jgi:hypothetical protein
MEAERHRKMQKEEHKNRNKVAASKSKDNDKLRRRINGTFDTVSGLKTLRFIAEMCGHNKTSVCVNPTAAEINEKAMVFNEGRRSVYLELRKFLDGELLFKAEYEKSNEEDL